MGASERLANLNAKIAGAWQLIAIAEDRDQSARDRQAADLAADPHARNAVGLQLLVQPLRPFDVALAVADERPIARHRHRRCPALLKRRALSAHNRIQLLRPSE